ncbi:glycosyltransferase family 4 protein [Spirosoma flavum]|uniref:Glycosyltransferase family 4 protein n=1 Tax=Spirosoma flavum TaxID=2048557 RepID=A0ABW6AMQ5_9BACT
MRILIVHNLLWAHYKSSVFQAFQRLVDQQINVSVHVLQIARNERSRAGLETINPDETTPVYTYDYELLFDRYLEEVSLRERAQALLQRAKAYKPDVINLTGYYDPAQILLLLWAKSSGIRVVMQNESTGADQPRGGWKEQFKRWLFQRCDGFFCFGSQSADYLIQLGVNPEKILLRKNAVDNDVLQSVYEKALPDRVNMQQAMQLRANNFVFVGRLIEAKNLPMLLTAFAEALKYSTNSTNWGLILLGDGAERDNLNRQITTLDLVNRITILPGRPWFRVPEVLALSDVLVLPSRSEPWGLVVNEAMACGLPVLVSDRCGCVTDLVPHGQTGFVFDPDQPDQLTHWLIQFMNGSVNTQQMGQFAKQFIAPYSPEAVAQEMLDGFRKIMN